jgi:hypothetical protein
MSSEYRNLPRNADNSTALRYGKRRSSRSAANCMRVQPSDWQGNAQRKLALQKPAMRLGIAPYGCLLQHSVCRAPFLALACCVYQEQTINSLSIYSHPRRLRHELLLRHPHPKRTPHNFHHTPRCGPAAETRYARLGDASCVGGLCADSRERKCIYE